MQAPVAPLAVKTRDGENKKNTGKGSTEKYVGLDNKKIRDGGKEQQQKSKSESAGTGWVTSKRNAALG